MTGEKAKSAAPEWFRGAQYAGSVTNAAFGFRVPQPNAIVHADPRSSEEMSVNFARSWVAASKAAI